MENDNNNNADPQPQMQVEEDDFEDRAENDDSDDDMDDDDDDEGDNNVDEDTIEGGVAEGDESRTLASEADIVSCHSRWLMVVALFESCSRSQKSFLSSF